MIWRQVGFRVDILCYQRKLSTWRLLLQLFSAKQKLPNKRKFIQTTLTIHKEVWR